MTDLVLTPRDGLFLKDGREWATSADGRAHSQNWPMPSTLFGALVTALGRSREAAGKDLSPQDWLDLASSTEFGPGVALRRPLGPDARAWTAGHRVWPVPADALFLADAGGPPQRVRRLDPRPSNLGSLGRDDDPAREALWHPQVAGPAKPAASPPWWGEEAFVDWLADPAAERPCEGGFRGLALPRHVQSHVGIDPSTLAAREEILFGHDVVETVDDEGCEWAIGCRISSPREDRAEDATLGGDRRRATVAVADADIFAYPPALAAAFARLAPRGLRLLTVTPAIFAEGWLPDGFSAGADAVYRGRLPGLDANLVLRAALVPRATHVSGWDMARSRPKPTTRLVPPGAVYHLVRADGEAFTAETAKTLWLIALGDRTNHGFGRFVPGLWHPEEEST